VGDARGINQTPKGEILVLVYGLQRILVAKFNPGRIPFEARSKKTPKRIDVPNT
jgi:hypothetical protein